MFSKLLTTLAVCASTLLAAGHAAAADRPLEIGYLPILPMSQLFVALESDTLQKKGAPAPKLVPFQSGPALTQALVSGQLDVAYVGIGPALVARSKGADIKVLASNIVEQVNVIALGPLASYFASGDPATAFARFAKDHNRKPTIASYPKGAVPETAFQYWIRERLKVDPGAINLIYQGEAQIQQSLTTGAIDGAVALEPTVSVVLSKLPDARVVAQGSAMFPRQPGAVLLAREKLIKEQPEAVQQIVNAHVDATRLLRDNPAKAAGYVQKYVAGGRLDKALVEKAIRRSHDQFVANPYVIIGPTRDLQKYQAELGTLDSAAVTVEQLFDMRFFDKAPK
ncbi:ABC transporter substrate-binding protein [Noviherbaspirillum humi]|nr:ABC transporter substrate-binding protein [Noviherbaspirillum humi]